MPRSRETYLEQWCNEFEVKYLNFYENLDKQISHNLSIAGIETRPTKSNGLWCLALLPTILFLYNYMYEVHPVYRIVTYVSAGLMVYCILVVIFMNVSCLVIKDNGFGGCTPSSLISTLFLYWYLNQDLTFSIALSFPSTYLFSFLLRSSIVSCPKTFTIGEAMIVNQGLVLSIVLVALKMIYNSNNDKVDLVNAFIGTVLYTVGLIVAVLYLISPSQRSLTNLAIIISAAALFALFMLYYLLGPSCIMNIIWFIFMDQKRAQLFTFWLFLLIVAVLVVVVRTKMAVKADTGMRKAFHVLASFVFLSGMLVDLQLIKMASGAVLGLVVLLEALRLSNIKPISTALQSAFTVYSDEKDCGSFAVSPIYLYLGLACPLVLVPPHPGDSLELLSGVLSTGIGDTAASWFGSKYGNFKWSASNRTIEGTLFNILSQIGTIYGLLYLELFDCNNAMVKTVVAAMASGLVESRTEQIDNLVLPLVTIIAFQVTYFMF